jgi:hypothetical protein
MYDLVHLSTLRRPDCLLNWGNFHDDTMEVALKNVLFLGLRGYEGRHYR